jgi:hypothetical protein
LASTTLFSGTAFFGEVVLSTDIGFPLAFSF